MKNKSRVFIALFMAVIMLAVSGCSFGKTVQIETPAPEETVLPAETEAPTAEPTAEPTPEPTVEPEPEITPEPTPEPIPEVTPEPTPDPARFIGIKTSELIRITKHPGGEKVTAGQNAMFIAHADNDTSVEWRFVAPDKSREVLWNDPDLKKDFPGVSCRGGNDDTFYVDNIPEAMNGWTVVALFTDKDGGMIASDGAKITVNGAPAWTPTYNGESDDPGNADTPTNTPTPTNPPTPTPTPTQPPAPTPTPTQPPVPTPTPTQPPAPTPTPTQPPAHTHSYSSSVVAPTCTSGGYTVHTCSCGASYTDSETAALGHDWVVHTEHVQVGTEVHNICKDCGQDFHGWSQAAVNAHVENHIISDETALGGYYSTSVPIYDDITTYTCSRCGATQ